LLKIPLLSENQIPITKNIITTTKTFTIKKEAISQNSNTKCINNNYFGKLLPLISPISNNNSSNRDITTTTTTTKTKIPTTTIMEIMQEWEPIIDKMDIISKTIEIQMMSVHINLMVENNKVMMNKIMSLWIIALRL